VGGGRGLVTREEQAELALKFFEELVLPAWLKRAQQVCPDLPFTDDDTAIEYLPLSVRAYNTLANAGVKTAGQARHASDAQLLKIKNFGKGTLREVRQLLGHGALR
jgi:DNA-directed RNA polymerase alpha subunit